MRAGCPRSITQPMNRNITGTIRKTDGTVWDGAVLEFELERSSFDESAQYPNRVVRAAADESGEISVSLWINEDALRPSRYICTLPDGSQFRFNLPSGFGGADLNQLRETAVEDDSPTQNTLVAFLPVMRTEAQAVVNQAVSGFEAEIATKANQSALNTTNANLATLDTEVDTKASQAVVDDLSDSVVGLTGNVSSLSTAVATKAAQSALDSTNASVNALLIELDSKAKQTSLDSTDANVSQLFQDLDSLSHQVDDKAAQVDLNTTNANLATANADIATRARQTALNTTNSNVTALSAVVDTKAAQSALTTAIANLESAISAAQTTLENLIEQKADLAHTHEESDIVSNSLSNSVGYFDANGHFTGTDQFVFAQGNLGLGTGDPEYTVDLRHPSAAFGNQARIFAILDNPAPILQLAADPTNPQPVAINFDCGGVISTIDADASGNLGLGLEGITSAVVFRTLQGSSSFLGMLVGFDDPSDLLFPPLSWGFYKRVTHLGFNDATLFMCFHDGEVLHTLSFGGK
jgi:hypothetical protein